MKHLLVIADKGTTGKNFALMRALALREHTGATITLLGFCYANIDHVEDLELARLSRTQLEKKIVNKRQAELKEITANLAPDAKLEIKALWGKEIAPAINAYCRKKPVDMVIKSANRSENALYTPTDWQLFRQCPVPVMIVASKSWKKKARVLAAVDFATKVKSKAKLNHSIVDHAQKLADALGDELHLAYALTVPTALIDMDLIDPREYNRKKRAKLQPTIDQFMQQYGLTKDQLHIKQGKPEKVIASVANTLKADIVVAGTVGRKGVKGKLIGNTAEGVLNKLHTDILAIKP